MDILVPSPIQKGDIIGFISPSAGPAVPAFHRIENAKKMLESLGYRVKLGRHTLQSRGYVSGTIEERVSDIHEMFRDSEVKMIMCTTGGNNSNHLLKYIDYSVIRENPKIFMGYSDITLLHYAFFSQAKLATYYGPCAMTQFGEYPKVLDYTLDYFNYEVVAETKKNSYTIDASKLWTEEFLDWSQKKDLQRPRRLNENTGYEWLREGVAEGPALGGAILSINHLVGTRYWCDPTGSIFFFDILKEDSLLNEGAVDALLTDLDNIDFFDVITGLIVSRPAGYSVDETTRLKDIFLSYSSKKKCPILFNANIGHTDPIATIRYGRMMRLDSSKNLFIAL